ncbi:hypothetical protein D3C87_1747280 [compost metagenome]
MGHGAEHARALLHLFDDAALHLVEGVRRLPRFPWTGFIERLAVEVFAQALGGVAQTLDWSAQQFGAVPRGDDQRDQLKRQRHHWPTEPWPWRSTLESRVGCRTLSVKRFGKLRGRRWWWRAVIVKPGKRQQVRQDNRH